MSLSPGTQLGTFLITGFLGEGGMGEVYRAKDTKLGRDVAIKVLPAAFAQDRERLIRFKREAKILASLDHSNIGALYDFCEENGTYFLVLQLIEGNTLAERIERGPISVKEALPLFAQIAEALEAAHEQGIIHRDLKPANIKVTAEGKIKVLDFGMAKIHRPPKSISPTAPTRTSSSARAKVTTDGAILGTPNYMSPEQARGHDVDTRSDIWAFGCCLYEALTGKVPFKRDSVVDTMNAILHYDPDWSALPKEAGPEIVKLIKRCLEKDARGRLRDIGDARIEICEVVARSSTVLRSGGELFRRRALPKRLEITVAIFILASIAVGLYVAGYFVSESDRPGGGQTTALPADEIRIEDEQPALSVDFPVDESVTEDQLSREVEAMVIAHAEMLQAKGEADNAQASRMATELYLQAEDKALEAGTVSERVEMANQYRLAKGLYEQAARDAVRVMRDLIDERRPAALPADENTIEEPLAAEKSPVVAKASPEISEDVPADEGVTAVHAAEARAAALEMRQQAKNAGAEEYVREALAEGQELLEEGEGFMVSNDFGLAVEKFDGARLIFARARRDSGLISPEIEDLEVAREGMALAKSKADDVDASRHAPDLYQKAGEEALEAGNLNDRVAAATGYEQAMAFYEQAASKALVVTRAAEDRSRSEARSQRTNPVVAPPRTTGTLSIEVKRARKGLTVSRGSHLKVFIDEKEIDVEKSISTRIILATGPHTFEWSAYDGRGSKEEITIMTGRTILIEIKERNIVFGGKGRVLIDGKEIRRYDW